ncbi:MAG: transcriptional regulator [Lachnospiraceae bacterium]
MISTKEAVIDAKEISRILGVGMTKAYAVIKAYNAELDAQGDYTMRGKCPRKY